MSGKIHLSDPFIVKIQLSEYTTAGTRQILVYNEDHSVYWQDNAGHEILKAMRGRPKVYFLAIRAPDGVIHVGDEVKDQDW
jgi:hypothetical protein